MPEKCWILKSFLKNFQFTHFFRLTYYHWAILRKVEKTKRKPLREDAGAENVHKWFFPSLSDT